MIQLILHKKEVLLSAQTMSLYYVWFWLIGEDEFVESLFPYENYGRNNLYRIKDWLREITSSLTES